MISFRYHLVSIIAVFLALALGIVVGTTALNGPITTDLRKQVNTLKGDRNSLAQQVKTLQGQIGDANSFAQSYGAQIVANSLNKQNVLLVTMPGASSTTVDGVVKQIAAAGGSITGNLGFTSSYTDDRRGSDITSLLTTGGLHPAGVTLPEVNDPGQLGGAVLAYVLLGKGEPTDLTQVIAGFSSLHMVSVNGNSLKPATTVVVVGTGSLPNGSYAAGMELSFVTALQAAGGHVVVAGNAPSATQSGLVAAVRGSGADKTTVSTVDNADTAIGEVSTTLALADIISTTAAHHYGTGKGAEALFPAPSK